MKIFLKLLFVTTFLAGALYASAPMWLPYLISWQLPDGWHLDSMDMGYPGLSGTQINSLRAHGSHNATEFKLSATGVQFSYAGSRTEIDTLVIEAELPGGHSVDSDTLTLEDLNLPVADIQGRLPRLEVHDLRLLLHHQLAIAGDSPLVLDLEALLIDPVAGDSFDAAAGFTLKNSAFFSGRIAASVSPDGLDARINFPEEVDAASWLSISVQQQRVNRDMTTRLGAVLDTDLMEPALLEPIMQEKAAVKLTGISGKLELQAEFSGQDLQRLKRLSLTAPKLELSSNSGVLDLEANLLANLEGQDLIVTLAGPASVAYLDKAGLVDKLLTRAAPGFQRAPRPEVATLTSFAPDSRLIIQTGSEPSLSYTGDLNFEMTSSDDRLTLQAAGLELAAADFSSPDTFAVEGQLTLDWKQDTPLSYKTGDQVLKADRIAVEMDLFAEEGRFVSSGRSTLTNGSMPELTTTAERIEVQWRDFDLASLTGPVETQTRGLAIQLEGKTWTGFDLDLAYRVQEQMRIEGAGTLKIKSGPELPLEFIGNTAGKQWQITLPPATLKLESLPRLLAVGQLELPETARLSSGSIDYQGQVETGDRLTAQIGIKGHDMTAAMSASSARGSSFELAVQLDETLRVQGPLAIGSVALAGGIDMSNARAELSLQDMDDFQLSNLYAELFDGQLHADSLEFSDNRLAETTARLSQINFGRLLEFTDINGLAGTGTLEISLPLGSDATGIYIKNGTFSSTGPGRIAYTREGMADSNIGFRALENFLYKELSGTLNYQSDGSYRIAIHLEGRNPDLYDGHPIVFNLNIGGILPELFEALFMTGDFEESILKQIQIDKAQNPGRSG
jgi:hypothetical protein